MMTIYFVHLPPDSSHFHPLQVENCGSNLRLVVDGDDNSKSRLERVNVGLLSATTAQRQTDITSTSRFFWDIADLSGFAERGKVIVFRDSMIIKLIAKSNNNYANVGSMLAQCVRYRVNMDPTFRILARLISSKA